MGAFEFRRDQYGLTCSEMAQVLGMARSHYSEFVAGKRGLPFILMPRGVPFKCNAKGGV